MIPKALRVETLTVAQLLDHRELHQPIRFHIGRIRPLEGWVWHTAAPNGMVVEIWHMERGRWQDEPDVRAELSGGYASDQRLHIDQSIVLSEWSQEGA